MAALALAACLLAGCTTRSISNAGYDENSRRYGAHTGNYHGELSELEIVGVSADAHPSEADIRSALATRAAPILERRSRALLIQSGAAFPADAMLSGLGQRLHVQAFSGQPSTLTANGPSYSVSLRLAAARGGYDKIICYWGVLESEQIDQATKLISWVPLAGSLLPDQQQAMRLRLKAAIVDVASGSWTFVAPPSVASTALNSRLTRRNTDQTLVRELKTLGYENLISALTADLSGK